MITCPYCGAQAMLVGGDMIYRNRPDLSAKKFWRCAPCDAYVGTHANRKDHAPLGRLATAELRRLKMQVHSLFDPLWHNGGPLTRSKAYAWLAQTMGIPSGECHVGMFDEARCRAALAILREVQHARTDTTP